jgi:hypothetical protein
VSGDPTPPPGTGRLSRPNAAPTRSVRSVVQGSRPRSWFADEVAIDFPAVEPVIDRMRDAFLALDETRQGFSTEIALSAVDAVTGTIVPLELPIRRTCQPCGGRGETWTECCHACGGSGEALFTHSVQLSIPPGVTNGASIRVHVSPPHAPSTCIDVRVRVV